MLALLAKRDGHEAVMSPIVPECSELSILKFGGMRGEN